VVQDLQYWKVVLCQGAGLCKLNPCSFRKESCSEIIIATSGDGKSEELSRWKRQEMRGRRRGKEWGNCESLMETSDEVFF